METKKLKNMDRQDAQDNRDGRLLHGKLALAMTRCGITEARDYRTTDSQKYAPRNPVNPVHRC